MGGGFVSGESSLGMRCTLKRLDVKLKNVFPFQPKPRQLDTQWPSYLPFGVKMCEM